MQLENYIGNGVRDDLFEGIEYQARPGKGGKVILGIQHPHRFVMRWKFVETWNCVRRSIATADRDRFHSTEDLFNDSERWSKYDIDIRRDFGRCLAYFVKGGMLPLFCVNPEANNKLYAFTC